MKTFIVTSKKRKSYSSSFLSGKLILFIIMLGLLNTTIIFSQTTLPLSFTPIPYSDPDVISPEGVPSNEMAEMKQKTILRILH